MIDYSKEIKTLVGEFGGECAYYEAVQEGSLEAVVSKLNALLVGAVKKEIEDTIKNLRATYKSAVAQGLAGIMKWEISDSIDKLEKRLSQLTSLEPKLKKGTK